MPDINLNEINWLAVLVAAVAAFMVGGLWYGVLFGKPWSRAQGWSDERIAELKAKMSPPKFFGGMLVSYLLLAFTLAALATAADVETLLQGLCLAGILWVCVAAVTFTHHVSSGKLLAGYLIDTSCEFVYLLIMGAIIGAWR